MVGTTTMAATPITRARSAAASDEEEAERDSNNNNTNTSSSKRPRRLVPPPTPAAAAAAAPAARHLAPVVRRHPAPPVPRGGGLGPKLGDGAPLRLIVLGHNPSDAAWAAGHFYGHGSNKMWPLLARVGVSPPGTPPGPADDLLPRTSGVGFLDVGTGHPGTQSAAFSSADFARWRPAFYARLRAHVAAASARVGGDGGGGCCCSCGACGAPVAVAFAGKRQFQELLALPPMTKEEEEQAAAAAEAAAAAAAAEGGKAAAAGAGGGGGAVKGEEQEAPLLLPPPPPPPPPARKAKKKKAKKAPASKQGGRAYSSSRLPPVELGLQRTVPAGWPLPPSTRVYVTATTSGAAGMTTADREASWRAMWADVGREPWPRNVVAACVKAE
jgi:TDG/mug DNA glycosylase family protein